MAKNPSGKLTLKHIVGYGCGDCGGVVTLYMISGFMARYLQVHLQINAGVLATMLLIWNIWDAVNDPLMGTIMDMCFAKAKPGSDKFRPWILASIPIIMIGLVSFYWVPPRMGGGIAMLVSAFLLKIVYEAGYTMMNIGMGSLLGNMAKNDSERATLASARGFGSTFGGMIGGFIIPQALAKWGDNTQGYFMGAVFCAIVGGVIIFLHYALTEERNKTVNTTPKTPEELAAEKIKVTDIVTVVRKNRAFLALFLHYALTEERNKTVNTTPKTPEELAAEKIKVTDIVTVVRKNRAFLALLLHSICICAVQSLGQGAASYMYMDVLHNISIQSYVSIMSSVSMIAILAVAPILAKKWDLVVIIRTCLMAGFFLFAGLLAYTFFAPSLNAWVFAIWNALATAMITMSVQMQWGLVAEAIDYNEYITGKRNEGSIYGFFSLSRRVGSTIASSLSVLIIAGIGYNPELTKMGLEQAASTVSGIKLMVVGFPLLAALGSWACFTFIWNINQKVRDDMAAGLEQAASTVSGIKLMVVGFPLLAALGSWACFTFIWNINQKVRDDMAAWKAAKAQ